MRRKVKRQEVLYADLVSCSSEELELYYDAWISADSAIIVSPLVKALAGYRGFDTSTWKEWSKQ